MEGTPQISRSGRVLKKSAKVKEMEDLDIPDFEMQGKPRKKSKGMDDFDEFDDKRVAPLKIPKISLNMTSPVKKKSPEMAHTLTKVPFPSPVKSKLDPKHPLFQDSSPEGSKESDSNSSSSETSSSSSSSSDDSDSEIPEMQQKFTNVEMKSSLLQNIQRIPVPQEKVIVEPYRQFDSPVTFDHNNEMSMDASEDETSESGLVIAEESNDSGLMTKGQRGGARKKPVRKDTTFSPSRGKVQRRKPPSKEAKPVRKKKPEGRSKPLTAYMLWCTENRKRIAASMGNIGFANLGKKMGEIWQALPEKEKMAWRRKAKKLALKNSGGLISTGPNTDVSMKVSSSSSPTITDDVYKNLVDTPPKTSGTSPIDSAAYLKLLGDSLSIIGQRLTEHEGQLAVHGIFSVLLDSVLCVIAPLLCLTAQTPVLNSCPQEVCRRTLDNIAYFMPGL